MDELPADAAAAAPIDPAAGDAVANLVEPAELLGVEVDQVAWMIALISARPAQEGPAPAAG